MSIGLSAIKGVAPRHAAACLTTLFLTLSGCAGHIESSEKNAWMMYIERQIELGLPSSLQGKPIDERFNCNSFVTQGLYKCCLEWGPLLFNSYTSKWPWHPDSEYANTIGWDYPYTK